MAIDTQEPQSPGWWFAKLLRALAAKQDPLNRLDRYYRGDCDLPEGAQTAKDAYRRFQRKARLNLSELIVDAVAERMQVTGFRTGGAGDISSDSEAWRIWQANSLDADHNLVTRNGLVMRDGYVIVGPNVRDPQTPIITPEDPRQVITAHDPIVRRRVIAALKTFTDDWTGLDTAYLYLPGQVWKAQRRGKGGKSTDPNARSWDWVGDEPQLLDIDDVPVVRFPNRQDTSGATYGEFETALDTIDRVNHMVLQRLVIATLQAFRQRAIKNVATQDDEGNDVDFNGLFSSGPDALWVLPENAELWESASTDMGPILQAVKDDIRDLAAVTRTPLYYLAPDAANGSAEGASLAREGLIFKTQDRIVQASESWEQVMELAFRFAGDSERASRGDMETLWMSPERHSLAESYDAAVKAVAAGVPWRTVMSAVLGFSPQEIDRMEADRTSDALLTMFNTPPAPAPNSTMMASDAQVPSGAA